MRATLTIETESQVITLSEALDVDGLIELYACLSAAKDGSTLCRWHSQLDKLITSDEKRRHPIRSMPDSADDEPDPPEKPDSVPDPPPLYEDDDE